MGLDVKCLKSSSQDVHEKTKMTAAHETGFKRTLTEIIMTMLLLFQQWSKGIGLDARLKWLQNHVIQCSTKTGQRKSDE